MTAFFAYISLSKVPLNAIINRGMPIFVSIRGN